MRLARLSLLPLAGGVSACASMSQAVNQRSTELAAQKREIVCIDGVEYIGFESWDGRGGFSYSFTPHWKANATLYTCAKSDPAPGY